MKLLAITFIVLISFYHIALALPGEEKQSNHHEHHHGNWEIGLVGGASYLLSENETAFGMHIHILRKISNSRFSLGLGVESIFDEHKHLSASLIGKFDIWKGLSILAGPGILFVDDHNGWEKSFSTHLELLYEFKVSHFHIGPTIGYSYSKIDQHLALGIHFGISF
jgi:hypothetical protein